MASGAACPKCNSNRVAWSSTKGHVPADVLSCQDCQTVVETEDWVSPVAPLYPGRCVNCGARFDVDKCVNCELTRKEVVQVHFELRGLVPGQATFHDAAKEAARIGRRVLALKLATAGAASNEAGRGVQCRAMRIWLLQALGHTDDALLDARAWVETTPDPPGLAWAIYGQQLQQSDNKGGASDAYGNALRKDEAQHALRAKRARLLLDLRREGQACDEAVRLIEMKADDASLTVAVTILEELCDAHEKRYRDDEVGRMLDLTGDQIERSARLMAHRARIFGAQGDYAQAKKWLKKAQTVLADLDIYARVLTTDSEDSGTERKGWWWGNSS